MVCLPIELPGSLKPDASRPCRAQFVQSQSTGDFVSSGRAKSIRGHSGAYHRRAIDLDEQFVDRPGSQGIAQAADPAFLFRAFLGRHVFGCRCRADDLAELRKEITGQLLRGSIDQTAAELGDLAADFGPRGIRVNALSAGPVRTLAGSGITDARLMFNYQKRHSPLKKSVSLDDIGGAALYLLSPLSGGVTGEVHFVDAGYNIMSMPRPGELKEQEDNEAEAHREAAQ